MKARLVISGTALGCSTLLMGALAPAQAGPVPTTEVIEDLFSIWADDTNEVAAFMNTTRETFCTAEVVAFENDMFAWSQTDMSTPAPQPPSHLADTVVTATLTPTGGESFRRTFSTRVPVELWTFEGGKSAAEWNLVGPCMDTDGIIDGTDDPTAPGKLFAEGAGTFEGKDNDAFGTGPRTNIWGERLTASLSGPGGDYRYQFSVTNQGRPDDYIKGWTHFSLTGR